MSAPVTLKTPLREEDVDRLKIGDRILISGAVYTARDAAHKRMIDQLDRGEKLPFDVRGQIIYYVGPSPARPGRPIGAAGPTTSYRMDAYSPRLMEEGLRGMIGKGMRSAEVIDAMKRHRCVYMAAVGGAAALLSRCIKSAEVIAYEDLGPEAVRRLEVEDFPVILVNDVRGHDLYEEGARKYRR
jgi:fumarate hydratase subunit beta